jgi:hypothetical protein
LNRAGIYWLVALKEGYTPGLSRITVKPIATATAVPLPQTKTEIEAEVKLVNSAQLQVASVKKPNGILRIMKLEPAELTIDEAEPVKK